MSFRDSTFLFAALGHLVLALLAFARIGKSSLARPLALVALCMFTWTAATFCGHHLEGSAWRALDTGFTALTPAAVLHFVMAFTARARAHPRAVAAGWLAFGTLAASSFVSVFTGPSWIESSAWQILFLLLWLPTLAFEAFLLVRHLRGSSHVTEKARTRLVLVALFAGSAMAATDALRDLGLSFPSLSALGSLLSAVLLAIVALRFALLEDNLERSTTVYAIVTATSMTVLYGALVQLLKGNLPALVFSLTVLSLVLALMVRETARSLGAERGRLEHHAALGRLSAQMAHDLKNPLAALLGALDVQRGAGRLENEFDLLIREQAERIRTMIEHYERLGRVEPQRTSVSFNTLVRDTVTRASLAAVPTIAIAFNLEGALGELNVDADLLSAALENIVRNALEARTRSLVVETTKSEGLHAVAITDNGEGMNPRQAERAFDAFYTNKPTGSGLGLAFVQRVAHAHGGDAEIQSTQGKGTTVRISIRNT
jgi:two-component system, NtrC family, sensor histidine kinase HydH